MIMDDKQTLYSDIKYLSKKLNVLNNKYNLIKKALNKIKNDRSENALEERYKLLNTLESVNGSLIRHKRIIRYLNSYLELAFPEGEEK